MTQPEAALEAVIADQPGRNFFTFRRRGHHRGGVIVVAVGFVDEALASGQHANQAGFGAVDDVGEMPRAAVRVRDQRNRGPCGG